ncbi:hypothetical protein OF829_14515 [Sphingomonas sp. LB-2]|uniref:hypothetical protein n=1 Tax=Sphingomonas caeni TaxID=2984949 RepID=UPI00222FA975|nr:hypothetical protein [Sphingomonas caeni]MCW3848451.1 hypothetical protein [Sphingomonas caeni]
MEARKTTRSIGAFAVSSLFAAALVTVALPVSMWSVIVVYWFVTVAAFMPIGLPLYLAARATGRVNAWSAAIAGALTGVTFPLLLSVPALGIDTWRVALPYLLAGAASGLVFRLVLNIESRESRLRIALGAAALAASSWVSFQPSFAYSCHIQNLRGALLVGPHESFYLDLPESEWEKARGEIERFAHENGWTIVRDLGPPVSLGGPGSIQICGTPGTLISARPFDRPNHIWEVSVTQHRGDEWQATFPVLRKRLVERWPGAVREIKDLPVDKPSPSPTPSSAAR